MIIDALIQALQNFASVDLWLYMGVGIAIGLVFGIIPGLTGMMAVAMLLPFVFVMKSEQALPLMLGLLAVQFQGGLITAILLNVPGTPPNAATMLDGFPMARRGEAGRAMGAGLTASAAGSIFAAVLTLAMIPLVIPLVMVLRTADMVFMILLGIAFVGVLSAGSMIKGLISGGVGLLISFIGYHATTAVQRFTFGSVYLYGGIPLLPLILGLFAVPEMMVIAREGGAIAKTEIAVKGMADVWRGVKDVVHHWKLCLRSVVIGFIAGVIPGLGPTPAAFIAYGQAKQTSKHPETFGAGNVEGVIAPETANNAVEAGALLTTLALGVPGSASMVLIMGAMVMLGLIPGPEMITKHLGLSLTLVYVILVAGAIGTAVCLPICPYLAKVAVIPSRILAPLVYVVVAVGVYAYSEQMADLIVTLIFAAVGLIMRRFGYNKPALLLGFILGGLFEKNFFIALSVGGPLFFLRAPSLIIIFVIIAVLVFEPIKNLFQRRKGVQRS